MYGKLFEQMYDGTLATKGPWQALVTFQQLIILADRNGEVDMTPEAISRRTTIPLEIIEHGIKALEEPDGDSRSPDLEGRRIVRLSDSRVWGWQLVNYGKYRAIRSQEERREYMRVYQRKRRESVNQNVNTSTSGKQNQPIAVSSRQYAVSKDSTPLAACATRRPPPKVNGRRISFDPESGKFQGITEADELRWQDAFPAVPIPPEIDRAAAWAKANPANKKSNWEKFLVNWFGRAQDRAPRLA